MIQVLVAQDGLHRLVAGRSQNAGSQGAARCAAAGMIPPAALGSSSEGASQAATSGHSLDSRHLNTAARHTPGRRGS